MVWWSSGWCGGLEGGVVVYSWVVWWFNGWCGGLVGDVSVYWVVVWWSSWMVKVVYSREVGVLMV